MGVEAGITIQLAIVACFGSLCGELLFCDEKCETSLTLFIAYLSESVDVLAKF
jgi:hypothetical protein